MKRAALLKMIADRIARIDLPHPVRLAVDGVDTAGKTTFADALAAEIPEAIRVSGDDFHNPRAIRYRQGRESATGYFEDAFDTEALIGDLLSPLGPEGDLRYKTGSLDLATDTRLALPAETATVNSVLIVDGVFLHRPELRDFWDLSIFLHIEFEEVLRRAIRRDRSLFGSASAVTRIYNQRYIPAQRNYLATWQPSKLATLVFDNTDPAHPS